MPESRRQDYGLIIPAKKAVEEGRRKEDQRKQNKNDSGNERHSVSVCCEIPDAPHISMYYM